MSIDNNLRDMALNVFGSISDSEVAASATAISKMVGYTKKNDKVCEAIDFLVEEGFLTVVSESPYVLYGVEGDVCLEDLEDYFEQDEASAVEEPVDQIFEAATDKMFEDDPMGYGIEKTRDGFLITFPGSSAKHRLNADERLLVINGSHRAVVKYPEDILTEFQFYTEENGIYHYTVTDVVSSSCISSKSLGDEFDFNKSVIFHVTISRHNKAGIGA